MAFRPTPRSVAPSSAPTYFTNRVLAIAVHHHAARKVIAYATDGRLDPAWWRWLSTCQSASWQVRTVADVRLTNYESVYVLRKP
jgi:hypothetical protein